MANAVRGEVQLDVGAKRYKLVLDFNALCELEDALDQSVAEIVKALQGQIRGRFLRAVLWGALQRHHAGLTQAQAGDLIQALGVDAVLPKIWEAISVAFPAKDKEDANASEGPRTRTRRTGAGTGTRSSSPGSSST